MEHLTSKMPCHFPYYVANPLYEVLRNQKNGSSAVESQIPVPCGKCPPCCERRASGWIFRLLQQEKISQSSSFVTLTYDTLNVPMTKTGYMTLDKRDFQLFMKRLRKLHPKGLKLSYYAVGEYGSTTFRPHFHAIIFNLDPNLVPDAWQLGDVHIGTVSGDSVAYTTKYMSKGKMIPVHANDDRLPEFSLMSKKLGANFLTPEMKQFYQSDISRNYITVEGGFKIAMPRYYREKIFTEEQRQEQGKMIASISKKALAKKERDYINTTGDKDGFVQAQYESKKADIQNYRAAQKSKRKTI